MIFHWDEKSFNSKEISFLHIPILTTWEPHFLEWHVVSTNNLGKTPWLPNISPLGKWVFHFPWPMECLGVVVDLIIYQTFNLSSSNKGISFSS
jgi:hypothetical protein